MDLFAVCEAEENTCIYKLLYNIQTVNFKFLKKEKKEKNI